MREQADAIHGPILPDRPPACLLAGGDARRLSGADKPLLDLAGRPLIAHILARLRPQAGPIAIAANGDPSRYAPWIPTILPDQTPNLGPLSGVLSALRWAESLGAPSVLVVPGDTPFLPPDLVARLSAAGPTAHAAAPGRAHYAVALIATTHIAHLHRTLSTGERRIGTWLASIGAIPVEWSPDPFANINTPADLAAARASPQSSLGIDCGMSSLRSSSGS